MDIEKLLNSDTFKNLKKEKLDLIRKFIEEIKGKDVEESFKLLIKYKDIFNKDNDITKEQRNSMINLILHNLPENMKEKINFILSMTNND